MPRFVFAIVLACLTIPLNAQKVISSEFSQRSSSGKSAIDYSKGKVVGSVSLFGRSYQQMQTASGKTYIAVWKPDSSKVVPVWMLKSTGDTLEIQTNPGINVSTNYPIWISDEGKMAALKPSKSRDPYAIYLGISLGKQVSIDIDEDGTPDEIRDVYQTSKGTPFIWMRSDSGWYQMYLENL